MKIERVDCPYCANGIMIETDGTETPEQLAEKAAIKDVLNMETHNGITKESMLDVIKYLWHMVFVEDEGSESDPERSNSSTNICRK